MAGYTLKQLVNAKKRKFRVPDYKVRDRIIKTKKGSILKLWGNTIAVYNKKKNVVNISDANYKSKTTKSRLNQLLQPIKISIKKRKWYIGHGHASLKGYKGKPFTGKYTIKLGKKK